MPFSVKITKPPSNKGATQTRTVEVAVTAPSERISPQVNLRASGSGNSFQLLGSGSTNLAPNETGSITFEEFIGFQPPYKVQVNAIATIDGEEVTVSDTAPVPAQTTAPQEETDQTDPDADEILDEQSAIAEENITPRIGPIEPVTMQAKYDLPWDRAQSQTACGRTIQNQNGDLNWRVTIEGILTMEQLRQLRNLRQNAESVSVRTAEFGTMDVAFDTLSLTRKDGEDVGEVEGNHGPIINFQLQTKENNQDSGTSFGEQSFNVQSTGDE